MSAKKGQIPWNKGLTTGQIPWNKGKKGLKKFPKELYPNHGMRGKHLTDEARRKISKALKGKPHPVPWLKGIPRAEEVRRKISEAQKGAKHHFFGKHHTEEWKRKMSEAQKGKPPTSTSFKKGHRQSEEVKRKIGLAHKGMSHTEEAKRKMAPTWFKKGDKIRLGARLTETTKRKLREVNLGKHLTGETKKKLHTARLKQVFPVKDTSIEVIMQNILLKRKIPFKTHYPIAGQPDVFIEPNICVFSDGCWWHHCPVCFPNSKEDKRIKDENITKELQRQGYKVLRFWEHELKQLPEDEIVRRVLAPSTKSV